MTLLSFSRCCGLQNLAVSRFLSIILRIAQVHLDIKPGNFCMHHKSRDPAEGVYIIDFGGARRATWAEDTDDEYVYFGTADYSGSIAMLQQMMPGPSDDIESLCYRCVPSCKTALQDSYHHALYSSKWLT